MPRINSIGNGPRRSFLFAGLLAGITLVLLANPFAAASSPRPSIQKISVIHQAFAKTQGAPVFASSGSFVLSDVITSTAAQELILSNAANNTSSIVQTSGASEMIGAGGHFVVASYCAFFCSGVTYETVSTAGKTHSISIAGTDVFEWAFLYANQSIVIISARSYGTNGAYLDEVNSTTGAIVANYSTLLPAGVDAVSAAPVGSRIYVGGEERTSTATGTTYAPSFGYIAGGGIRFATLGSSVFGTSASRVGVFDVMVPSAGSMYLGGYWDPSTGGSPTGLFYQFSPNTGTFTNLSGLLPHPSWAVLGMVHWGRQLALAVAGWVVSNSSLTAFTTTGGGLYTYGYGASPLHNRTSLWGPGFTAGEWGAFFAPLTQTLLAESHEYIVTAGTISPSGIAEINILHR